MLFIERWAWRWHQLISLPCDGSELQYEDENACSFLIPSPVTEEPGTGVP